MVGRRYALAAKEHKLKVGLDRTIPPMLNLHANLLKPAFKNSRLRLLDTMKMQ